MLVFTAIMINMQWMHPKILKNSSAVDIVQPRPFMGAGTAEHSEKTQLPQAKTTLKGHAELLLPVVSQAAAPCQPPSPALVDNRV